MQHKAFYQVPHDCYLFGQKHETDTGRTNQEEAVRQWALFELMRYYGYSLEQLEVEKTVKFGTRNGFSDIVVTHNNKPFIVIECKSKTARISKSKDPMKQAISYANADTIQAEYCVYTNGFDWQVKRKTETGWVSYPNIPRLNTAQQVELEFSYLLHNIESLKPVLHWLYQPISSS